MDAASSEDGRRRSGRLVLVVGPSAAGKDTLLALARKVLADRDDIVFATRLVTRSAKCGDTAEAEISREDFQSTLAEGRFALAWQAHGHGYAIPLHINDDLAAGRTIVINASRKIIAAARARFERLATVYIDASPDVRARRLAGRGRESESEIKERLSTADDYDSVRQSSDLVIDNNGAPELAALHLARFIAD